MAKAAKSERREDPPRLMQPVPAGGPSDSDESPSLWRALTPGILLDSTPAEWLLKLPRQRRHLLLLAVFAGIIFLPYLGAVGFWDPWEPEYNEVAREMIWRGDFIHPYYMSGYFLSKPVFMFWMMAIGQLLAGVNSPEGGISVATEWCVRTIFVLVAIGGVLMTYLGVARTISRRAGIWGAVILATSPFYFLMARQTVADIPFVAINTAAIACFMIAVFEKEFVQDGWLYAFYALAGVACLAKGLLGIALPGGAALLYLILSGDWRLLARLRLLTGPLLTLLVMGPWYGTMLAFRGLDYEDQDSFFQRFIIHDHFKRIGVDPLQGGFVGGVHTTTPNTTFTYFIEQLGFGFFPWVAAIPGAVASFFAGPRLTSARTRKEKAKLFAVAWAVFTFIFFSFSATKFHHYALPIVPPLAIVCGLFIEQLLEEGVSRHALALFVGFGFFALIAQNLAMEPKHFTDLFVYNYDRPYPSHEVDQATMFYIGHWAVTSQAVLGFMFGLAPIVALLGVPEFRRWLAAPDGTMLAAKEAELTREGRGVLATLITVPKAIARGFAWVMRLLGIQKPVNEETGDRLLIVGTLAVFALVFSVFMSSYEWRKLSHHWTQRDLFWEYRQLAKPNEPIGAYLMNWHGETFYSRNLTRQLKEVNELRDFVAGPGPQWVLVEEARLAGMKSTLGAAYNVRVVDKSNNKFALTEVTRAGAEEGLSSP
jgi:4-amino-4-deoxy-L-arabinose transferase-like glycosyltransferase